MSRTSIRGLALVLAAGPAAGCASVGASQSVAERIKENVVAIEVQLLDNSGAVVDSTTSHGFVCGERDGHVFVVATRHGVLATELKESMFYDHRDSVRFCVGDCDDKDPGLAGSEVQVLAVNDNGYDIALLSVRPPDGFSWDEHCLGRSGLITGEPVSTIGSFGQWAITTGTVVGAYLNTRQYALSGVQLPDGASGALAVDLSGAIGMITAADMGGVGRMYDMKDIEEIITEMDVADFVWDVEGYSVQPVGTSVAAGALLISAGLSAAIAGKQWDVYREDPARPDKRYDIYQAASAASVVMMVAAAYASVFAGTRWWRFGKGRQQDSVWWNPVSWF